MSSKLLSLNDAVACQRRVTGNSSWAWNAGNIFSVWLDNPVGAKLGWYQILIMARVIMSMVLTPCLVTYIVSRLIVAF